MRVVLTSARRSSSSVGVCLSLKDVAALKKHRFTLVSVLGSDQIELSFFIFVCLHCISPTDSNLNIIIIFCLCVCWVWGTKASPAECPLVLRRLHSLVAPVRSGLPLYLFDGGREPVGTACGISPVLLDHQLFVFFPPFDQMLYPPTI